MEDQWFMFVNMQTLNLSPMKFTMENEHMHRSPDRIYRKSRKPRHDYHRLKLRCQLFFWDRLRLFASNKQVASSFFNSMTFAQIFFRWIKMFLIMLTGKHEQEFPIAMAHNAGSVEINAAASRRQNPMKFRFRGFLSIIQPFEICVQFRYLQKSYLSHPSIIIEWPTNHKQKTSVWNETAQRKKTENLECK